MDLKFSNMNVHNQNLMGKNSSDEVFKQQKVVYGIHGAPRVLIPKPVHAQNENEHHHMMQNRKTWQSLS